MQLMLIRSAMFHADPTSAPSHISVQRHGFSREPKHGGFAVDVGDSIQKGAPPRPPCNCLGLHPRFRVTVFSRGLSLVKRPLGLSFPSRAPGRSKYPTFEVSGSNTYFVVWFVETRDLRQDLGAVLLPTGKTFPMPAPFDFPPVL